MPTKYTAPIYDGQKLSFQEFIWRCARETAAFEFMEGEPLDAAIPQHVEVDTSLLWRAKNALEELERLQGLSGKDVLALAEEKHQEALKAYRERADKVRKLKKSYEALLAQAETWVPPEDTYQPLKDFMINELITSIEADCNFDEEVPVLPTDLDAFHSELVLEQAKEVVQLVRGYYEIIFKAFGQEQWIKGLRNAVPMKEK